MLSILKAQGSVDSSEPNEIITEEFVLNIHYVIHVLPSSYFSIHNRKNHQKIYYTREGKQTFFVTKQVQLF